MIVTPITQVTPGGRDISLTIGREYEVLGIEADSYRILTDETTPYCPNDPVLYEPECFSVIDPTKPWFWVCSIGSDSERYCYPPEWKRRRFFEDYHDRIPAIQSQFWDDLRRYYPRTWSERKERKP